MRGYFYYLDQLYVCDPINFIITKLSLAMVIRGDAQTSNFFFAILAK